MLYPKILPAKSKYVDLHAAISIAYILDKTRDNFKLFALEQLLVSFIADQQSDWEPDWDLAAALSSLQYLLVRLIADQRMESEPNWDLAVIYDPETLFKELHSELERCTDFSRMIDMILISSPELVAAMEKYN